MMMSLTCTSVGEAENTQKTRTSNEENETQRRTLNKIAKVSKLLIFLCRLLVLL